VDQVYRVMGPYATAEVAITTRSQDRVGRDGVKRRTWFVDLGRCRLQQEQSLTEEGRRLAERTGASQDVAQQWGQRVTQGPRGLAFLDTVAAEDRERMALAWLVDTGFSPWSLPGRVEDLDPLRAYRDALQAYQNGGLLDSADFWAVPELREKVLE